MSIFYNELRTGKGERTYLIVPQVTTSLYVEDNLNAMGDFADDFFEHFNDYDEESKVTAVKEWYKEVLKYFGVHPLSFGTTFKENGYNLMEELANKIYEEEFLQITTLTDEEFLELLRSNSHDFRSKLIVEVEFKDYRYELVVSKGIAF